MKRAWQWLLGRTAGAAPPTQPPPSPGAVPPPLPAPQIGPQGAPQSASPSAPQSAYPPMSPSALQPGEHGAPTSDAAGPATPPAAVPTPAGAMPPELQYLSWLLGREPLAGPLTPAEGKLLHYLDDVIGQEDAWAALVPRARAIIPQLMHSLRDEKQSAQALSARVARDPNLVVEVLRLASNVGYGAGPPVADLTQAIGRLGTEGLRLAIARILLKPIFDAQADPLLARTADRLWQHAEATATLCTQMARIARVDALDAYLAGLMYNVGWTATFRALDRAPGGAPAAMSVAFAGALIPRRELLFARLVRSWSVSDLLDALAHEILTAMPAGTGSPLGTLLRSADRAAFLQLLRNPSKAVP